MSKCFLRTVIMFLASVMFLGGGQKCSADTHLETFDDSSFWNGDWRKFSEDQPLDNMAETPNTTIRSAYDWTKGWQEQGNCGNEQWPAGNFPVMMVAGTGNPSYEEYYLSASGHNVRWEGATLVSYNMTTCDITVSIINSDSTVLFSQDIFPGGQDTVVTIDFGNVAWDSGTMRLRVQDYAADQSQKVASGYWAIDNLSWSEDVDTGPDPPEPQCGADGGPTALIADLTNDCYVNIDDLKLFTEDWLEIVSDSNADLNRNQIVEFFDFSLFALLWMTCDAEVDANCSYFQCVADVNAGIYHYPSFDKVVVGLKAAGCGGAQSPLSALIKFFSQSSSTPLQTVQVDDFPADNIEVDLSTAGLSPGDYRVEAIIFEDDLPIMAKAFGLEIQADPVWLGNDVGKLPAGTVPAPWTNMTVNGTDISCWGRTYSYNNTVFPSQIESAGVQILNSSIKLVGTVNSSSETLTTGNVSITAQDNDRVELTSSGSLGALPVEVSTWIEYDGLCWITMQLQPGSPVQVSSLQLQIPLDDNYATLFCSDRANLSGTGKVGSSWNGEYNYQDPQVWIGDEVRGLYWCAESDENWHLNTSSNGLGYTSGSGEVVLKITFIDHNITISEPTIYSFGLMATPVKPKPPGWRNWRFGKGNDPGYTSPYYEEYANLAYFDYWCIRQWSVTPIPHWTTSMRVSNLLVNQGMHVYPYMSLTWTDPQSPEYIYYRDEWHNVPFALPDSNDTTPNTWRQVAVCANAESFQDWWLWHVMNSSIIPLNLHAMYFDMSMPSSCRNHNHGCGFEDPERSWPEPFSAGIYGPTSPEIRIIDNVGEYFVETRMLRTRDLARRYYIATRQHDPNFVSIYHTSGSLYLPVIAYMDTAYEGEQFRGGQVNYYDVISLAQFRAEFMGHNWGFVGVFLPEFASSAQRAGQDPAFWYTPAAEKEIRHLLGMILVHDSQVTPAYSSEVPYIQIREAQNEFGWDDSLEFLPYWDNAEYVTISPTNENLVVSVFRDPAQTKAMLVVFNDTDSNISSTITLNFANLGVSGTVLRDPINSESFPISGGQASVLMPYRDFRILFIE